MGTVLNVGKATCVDPITGIRIEIKTYRIGNFFVLSFKSNG